MIRYFLLGVALLTAIAWLSGCANSDLKAVIVYESGGKLTLGSGSLPIAMCQEEIVFLMDLYKSDRGNWGQRKDDPRTWLMHGLCVIVAAPSK